MCLLWQQWTETSVWFEDFGITTFHVCVVVVVVDLWQSLSDWRLLLSECVFVCHRENVGASIRALSVREFSAGKQITVLEHPPYSSDLAPNKFFLFPTVKKILKGWHFDDTDDVRSNTMAALKAVPQNQFQHRFEGWTTNWQRWEYSEGNHNDIQK
jgi:hypothetical protein